MLRLRSVEVRRHGSRSPDLGGGPDDDQEISRAPGRNQMLWPTRLLCAGMPGRGGIGMPAWGRFALEERW
jgi:hypothetical protein